MISPKNGILFKVAYHRFWPEQQYLPCVSVEVLFLANKLAPVFRLPEALLVFSCFARLIWALQGPDSLIVTHLDNFNNWFSWQFISIVIFLLTNFTYWCFEYFDSYHVGQHCSLMKPCRSDQKQWPSVGCLQPSQIYAFVCLFCFFFWKIPPYFVHFRHRSKVLLWSGRLYVTHYLVKGPQS